MDAVAIGSALSALLFLAAYRIVEVALLAYAAPLDSAAAESPHRVIPTTFVPGAPSETLLFGDPATCSRLLVVFPGNPGAPLFYLDVCAHIFRCAAPGGGLAVAVVGYAGHSAGSHGLLPAVHGLQAQVAHGIAAARALAAASPRGCRLLLAGHSIGAHVALAAARAGLPRAVARTVLWFPTIHHIGRSPNGVALLPLMKYGRGVLAAAAGVLACLPRRARVAVARWRLPAASPSTVAAALTLLHPAVPVNALWMALQEMEEVLAVEPFPGENVVAYYGEGDPWNSPGDVAEVGARLPRATLLQCKEGHPHGFVLDARSAARVAELTWGWIKDAAAA
jgi:hypothetical protein